MSNMDSENEEFELKIWKGDWGLPSVEYQSLTALAYCKFSSAPVDVIKTNNPWNSRIQGSKETFFHGNLTSGYLPVLSHNGDTANSASDIFDMLRRKGWGADHWLKAKESADVLAFTSLVEEKLLPAALHLWWVEQQTFMNLTLPWYGKALPFPLGTYLPRRTNRDCINRLKHQCGESLSDAMRENLIFKDAKECLNVLSTKLGDNEFFFGTRPTSFDAIVFGILAPLLKAPYPNTVLQTHLNGCFNLCSFTKRILDYYFPLSPEELQEMEKEEELKRPADPDFPHKKRNILLGAVVAISAMVSYAFIAGIIKFEVVNDLSHIPITTTAPNLTQFEEILSQPESEEYEEKK